MTAEPFVPPPYPYERIDRFKPYGDRFDTGLIDLSIGTPFDPPPAAVIEDMYRPDRFGRTGFGMVEISSAR